MNFGDILDQWERQNSGLSGGKKAGAGKALSEPDLPQKANPLDVWLRRNGVWDKDAAEEDSVRNGAVRRHRLRHKRPDAEIDIHGLTRVEAREALERFFNAARDKGLEKLLIIHGKGNHSPHEAVLKRSAREFIESCPFAGESGQAKTEAGGTGATWVLLKNPFVP
jgi:DNA-nicking Smr family endonuclease